MASNDIVLAFSGGLDTSFCVPYLQEQGWNGARIEPYGLFVIVALLAFGVLDDAMRPILRAGQWLLGKLLGH